MPSIYKMRTTSAFEDYIKAHPYSHASVRVGVVNTINGAFLAICEIQDEEVPFPEHKLVAFTEEANAVTTIDNSVYYAFMRSVVTDEIKLAYITRINHDRGILTLIQLDGSGQEVTLLLTDSLEVVTDLNEYILEDLTGKRDELKQFIKEG